MFEIGYNQRNVIGKIIEIKVEGGCKIMEYRDD